LIYFIFLFIYIIIYLFIYQLVGNNNNTSPTVSSPSLDEDMRALKRRLIDESSCLRTADARLIIAMEDIGTRYRPQHISMLKSMRLYFAHHMLGYLDLMLVYDTASKNTTNGSSASKNTTNGSFESSYCRNQWYVVNSNNSFPSNASSPLLSTADDAVDDADGAAMMMIPIAGIDMGSRKYGVVSLHYRASDEQRMMATKNWEPQSWTKLIEGIQYMYSMY
jgi:hypothetical protein